MGELIRASTSLPRRPEPSGPPSGSEFTVIVGREPVPVEGRITSILKRFLYHLRVPFRRLFDDATSRSEIVATFLAVLELSKNRRMRLEGDGEDMELTLMHDKGE